MVLEGCMTTQLLTRRRAPKATTNPVQPSPVRLVLPTQTPYVPWSLSRWKLLGTWGNSSPWSSEIGPSVLRSYHQACLCIDASAALLTNTPPAIVTRHSGASLAHSMASRTSQDNESASASRETPLDRALEHHTGLTDSARLSSQR